MNKITQLEVRRILELFYQGNSRKQISAEVRHSTATVQRVIKEHERKVKENGLISELSEQGLTEPIELARCYGEMKTAKVSIADCRDAVPVVQKSRSLNIEGAAVSELIDAAIAIGHPEFPRQQFVENMLRILRLEKTSRQTIAQLASTSERLNSEIPRLQAQSADLTAQIEQLQTRRTRMEQEIQSGEQRLAALRSQVARIPITEAQLETYTTDRDFLATLGFNMADRVRVRSVLVQFRGMGYNPVLITNTILQIGDLRGTIETLTGQVTEVQASLETHTKRKVELEKEIEKLESQRQELKKELEKEESETQKKIMDLTQKFKEKLSEVNASEADLADYVASRKALKEGGITL
jgi:predicted RNase H-like nuclease (RuvC/YqgF family)